MNAESLKEGLRSEGFTRVYEWYDAPGVEYPAHAHKDRVSMYILSGGLTFWFGSEEKVFKAGERFDVPIGKEHTAKVGSEGCTYVVGEMIEGDS
jgi:quercetin dioxygenase-like cupin family protein